MKLLPPCVCEPPIDGMEDEDLIEWHKSVGKPLPDYLRPPRTSKWKLASGEPPNFYNKNYYTFSNYPGGKIIKETLWVFDSNDD